MANVLDGASVPMGIMSHFDLSIRDQIEASMLNGASDSFFLFSGPPQFESIALDAIKNSDLNATNGGLCPLLFATSFVDPDDRPMDGSLMSMGTQKVIAAPSTSAPNLRRVQVGAGALVTKKPGRGTDGATEHWNFLKRVFYFCIVNSEMSGYFGEKGSFYGDETTNPNAVAPEYGTVWGNFGRSFVYKTPFGLMAVAVSKSGIPLTIKYYQGCVLQQVGPQLTAGINQPIIFAGSNGFSATYATVKTFTRQAAGDILITGNTDEAGYMKTFLNTFFKS
ncbi:MAG: hypothetical protein WC261_07040 [Synergistaceae bacterium]